jgi:hypothetical protein
MDFLKKNYEKILLGVILAGLVGALIFMPFYIQGDVQQMKTLIDTTLNPPNVKELANLDMTASDNAINRQKTPYVLDLDTTNKLFNPGQWQRALDNSLIPANTRTGPQVVVVTNITPLYLILTLDSVITNEFGARYVISAERQAERMPAKRHRQAHYVSAGDKPNDIFGLVQVKGAPENPDALVLKLTDTGDVLSIARDRPFQRVDGYSADFRYDPEKKVFHGRRAGDTVSFGGMDYIVTGVNQNEVILEDPSNQKKTSLPFAP